MHIQLEANQGNTIQTYTDSSITIQGRQYTCNILVSNSSLIENISLQTSIDEAFIESVLSLKPELIILGHNQPSMALIQGAQLAFAKHGLGIEIMTIGAACRTFNVLINENRAVVLGVIFEA